MKKIISILLSAALAFTVLAGCSKKPDNDKTKAETVPIVFGLDGADGVFSPYFSSAAYDTEIVGMTQLGMLTSRGASYAYGDDEACIVKDLDITYLDQNDAEISNADNAAYTRYDFLIKKGLKFSDGVDLTIKDVLFNLYVYLDPVYTGSATIYSTDIVGLEAYRTQSESEGAGSALDETAAQNAYARLDRISKWMNNQALLEEWGSYDNMPPAQKAQYDVAADQNVEDTKKDIAYFLPYFEQEIELDYRSAEASFVEDLETYAYDEGEFWQSYMFMYGYVKRKTDPLTGSYVRDEQDRYTFDFESADGYVEIKNYIEEYADENWQKFEGENEAAKRAEAKKEAAIGYVYSDLVGEKKADGSIEYNYANFKNTIAYSGSTNTLLAEIQASERAKLLKNTAGENAIRSVRGITYDKTSTFRNEKTKKTYELDGEYDVLHIKINKVDPKAIWNFAFTVAPLHYYSYPNAGSETEWNVNNNFGVKYADPDFMGDQCLKASEKLGVPVGAGPYKASKQGGLGENEKYPKRNEFRNANRVYYERNTYFDLVDGVANGGPIENAKIKYYQYKIVNSNLLLDSLVNNEIDVGNPTATNANITELNKYQHLQGKTYRTNGYGYVGINAAEIPDVWMRRAIIKAMDTQIISTGYYNGGLCELIYRPMSLESWAYPKNQTQAFSGTTLDGFEVDYVYDDSGAEIAQMLQAHGYSVTSDNRVLADPNGEKIPEITFTVAGDSQNHPAWQMFVRAKEVFAKIGIEVKVKIDAFALQKLASGQLAVWAAAWSSTIDPDMYQVYHKDSTAGSTLNWGYNAIKKDPSKYSYEMNVINELSDLIDEARTSLDDTPMTGTRAQLYHQALDLVMELAVEMPTYQRNDLTVFNSNKIDSRTINQSPTAFDGIFSRIWEVDYRV